MRCGGCADERGAGCRPLIHTYGSPQDRARDVLHVRCTHDAWLRGLLGIACRMGFAEENPSLAEVAFDSHKGERWTGAYAFAALAPCDRNSGIVDATATAVLTTHAYCDRRR